ncbi:MAG: hypothetical protein ABII13_01585 [Patescibacteria group bacterium]|nr:hypothetical protein [Patescibacteria group bacterium]MBU2509546.1 hypothetical protein [Patescibacteria group bacterium]
MAKKKNKKNRKLIAKALKETQSFKVETVQPADTKVSEQHEEDVTKGLGAIYKDESGKMPDLTKFEHVKSKRWLYLLVTAFLFAIIVIGAIWAGSTFLKPFRGFTGDALAIQIEGPENISLGEEITYLIKYNNRTSEPLASSHLRVNFPSDFVVSQTEPPPTDEDFSWRLGSIAAGGEGSIEIKGTFTGALGTVTAVQVVGTYRPASFSSDFETLATKVLNYKDSVLEGSLDVPVKALPGDEITIKYTVENKGEIAFEDLMAQFTLPEGFQLVATSSIVDISGRVALIPIGTIEAGASSTLSVHGSFASGVSGEAHVIAEAGKKTNEGIFHASQRSETSFTVLAGDLSLKMIVNGSDTDLNVNYGSMLRLAISYENTSSEDLKDVEMRLSFEAVTSTNGGSSEDLVDWSNYDDNASGTQKGDSVTWTKKQISGLGRLKPREMGDIDVSLDTLPSDKGATGLAVRVVLEATVDSVGGTKVERVVKSAPIVLSYITDAEFKSEARYFSEEGAPFGEGPLPPVVGQKTTYRVIWQINKNFHELKDLKAETTLSKIADWVRVVKTDAGELAYDSNTRRVVWKLNRLPENVNDTIIEFEITVTPNEADAGRFAKLMSESRLEFKDAQVDKTIVLTQPELTTDLQNDEGAQGKGVVRKE